MRNSLLDVVAVYANPVRWQSRLRLAQAFEQHMLDAGVRLTTVECAYGDRPFDLPDHPGINRVRVRSKTVVWNKECLINIGIGRLPEDWKYLAWIDADITFRRADWASETVHALQQYDVVQPWSDCYDLGPHDEHMAAHRSFLRQWCYDQPCAPLGRPWWKSDGGPYEYAHSGFAWAATRRAINVLGGLIDVGGMGSGDYHMALALIGHVEKSVPRKATPAYMRHLLLWQQRALQHINFNLGFVPGTVEHSFHGRKNQRQYIPRWDMFVAAEFDPDVDLKRNSYGVYELAGNKPRLQHQLDRYFRDRNEDVNSLS